MAKTLASVPDSQLVAAMTFSRAELADPPLMAFDQSEALTLLSVLPARAGGDLDAKALNMAFDIALDDIPAWALRGATRRVIREGTGDKRHKFRPTPAELRDEALREINMRRLRHSRLVAEAERRAEAKAQALRDAAPRPSPEDWAALRAQLDSIIASKSVNAKPAPADIPTTGAPSPAMLALRDKILGEGSL